MEKKPSLFIILSRSPWWLSVLLAASIFIGVRFFRPALIAASAAFPFAAIAAYAAWRQLRVPGEAAVADILGRLRTLSWDEFSAELEAGLRRDGYELVPLDKGAADYELRKDGRITLVSCKRWKVTQTGIAPLRELLAVREARGTGDCLYVSAGEFSPNAIELAGRENVRLLAGADLAKLFGRGVPKRA